MNTRNWIKTKLKEREEENKKIQRERRSAEYKVIERIFGELEQFISPNYSTSSEYDWTFCDPSSKIKFDFRITIGKDESIVTKKASFSSERGLLIYLTRNF